LPGCGYFHEPTDVEYVERAKAFKDKGDLRGEVIELKNALGKNPDNAEARRLLGEVALLSEDGEGAEEQLRKALALHITRSALLAPLAEALLLQRKYQAVLDEIDVPAELSAPERANLFAYRGQAWMGLGKLDSSRGDFSQGLTLDGKSALIKLGMAQLELLNKRYDQGEQILLEALKDNPEDGALWSFQGQVLQALGESDKADAAYSKAIQLKANSLKDRANRALLRIDRDQLDAAEEDVNALKKQAPGYFFTFFADGRLQSKRGKLPEAHAAFEKALKVNPTYPQAIYYMGATYLAENNLELADQHIRTFLKSFPNSLTGNQAMALVKFRERRFHDAQTLLESILKHVPDDRFSLNLLGQIEFMTGKPAEGLAHWQRLASELPESSRMKAKLGYGLLASGQVEKGVETLESVVEADPKSAEAGLLLVSTYLSRKEFDKAKEVIDGLAKQYPDNPLVLGQEGIRLLAMNDRQGAKKVFNDILAKFPGDPLASANLASIAIDEKQYGVARGYYQRILVKLPRDLEATMNLVKLDIIEGKTGDIEPRLKEAIKSYPNEPFPRVVLSRHYLLNNRPAEAEETLSPLQGKTVNPELLETLAEAQLQTGKGGKALETAGEILKNAPSSAMGYYLSARAHALTGDSTAMRGDLKKSLELAPDFLKARLMEIQILAGDKKLDQAERAMADLARAHPENTETLMTRAWLHRAQQRYAEAAQAYEEVRKRQPTLEVVLDEATALNQAGRLDAAIALLDAWVGAHPKDFTAYLVRANMNTQRGKTGEAIADLEKALDINPNSVSALNELAWRLRSTDAKRARELAEKAVKLAPNQPLVADTYAMILLADGEAERARQILSDALKKAPASPELLFHMGMAQQKLGATAEARASLELSLKGSGMFDGRQEAEALLRSLPR
jgi:putative PEP-CTERM system TPR-repeat lipoprotein